MPNMYDGVLQFRGTWRTYQKRVLDRSAKYLADKKLHIVAAPGSGKTTLGIELIRRLGAPCLILSPSITIRQQWIARMAEGFLLDGNNPEDWFSSNLREPTPITAITYQALHSCMKHYVGELKDEDDDSETETVDYSDFDIQDFIKQTGIKTVCLDEAHHLRSEWWKALEDFLKNIPDITLISLTATPPYDSTPAGWKRYTDLCGPIDEEIFTPELVKEGSLCPHQDYVYFNTPTADEKQAIKDFTRAAEKIMAELKTDKEFVSMIAAHRGVLDPMGYSEIFLEKPKYFSSILIFLHEMGIPFSPYLTKLTGTKGNFPKLNNEWMETLLQGFLYDDIDAYPCDTVYRETLIEKLKTAGCIHRKKVVMSKNEEITKVLVSSKGKLNSINDIIRAESESLGEELRLLILCDFIKKENLPAIGSDEKIVQEIGAVPIFENVRRQQIPGIRLGVLSGSVVIVPSDTEVELTQLFTEYGCESSITPLRETGYSKVSVKGSNHNIVTVITELFTRGGINTLVGTKSLLGEGWDSPCINSLILATYVGSFMLSNQMRGRAIRVFRDNPNKTSNIWHLACILPQKMGEEKQATGDYETLVRRFEAFLGVSYESDVIESGIDRLKLDAVLDSPRALEKCNKKTLKLAKDRDGLRRSWERSLKVIHDDMAIEEVCEMEQDNAPGFLFLNAIILSMTSFIIMLFSIILKACVRAYSIPLTIVTLISLMAFGKYGFRALTVCTPQRLMKKSADGILKALIEIGKIEEPDHCRTAVEEDGPLIFGYLKGGTTRDKTMFATCLAEFWGEIDNPRYILMRKKWRTKEYYSVPEVFGKRKEDAVTFCTCMKKLLGAYEAVYTRTPEGRRILLKARTRSFVNKNHRKITGKKKVKSEFE